MFVVAIESSVDLRVREVLAEFQLGKEPRRADVVVVRRGPARRKERPPTRMATVVDAMPAHTLFHFTGATDDLHAADAPQGMAYLLEYMVVADALDPTALAFRFVAPRVTEPFAAQMARLGAPLSPTARLGVFEGSFAGVVIRVVETTVACDAPREEVLRVLSPRFVAEDVALRPVDEADRDLYNRMYRCIEQLSHSPEGAMAKDTDLVAKRWERDVAKMLPHMDPAVVLAELTPEQRLAGLTAEEALCAMPLEALQALPEAYLRTLSPKTRARIRKRLGA
jgi:hypothetical protein